MYRHAYQRNPVTAGQVVTSLVFLGVGLLATSQANAAMLSRGSGTQPKPLPPPPGPADCAPYNYDAGLVDLQIGSYLDVGERDPALIAVNTATKFFGEHPDGLKIVFPPGPDAPVEALCVFDKVVQAVDSAFRERGLDPNDEQEKTHAVVWKTVSVGPGSEDLSAYPWNDAVLEVDNYPTPGTFNLIEKGDYGAQFFKQLVAAALAMAGADTAPAFDNNSKVGKRLRKEMRDLVICANDAIVTSTSATMAGGRDPGTNGEDDKGVTYMLGPNDRGLVWLPRHKDNLARLAQGLPQKRNISASGQKIGSGSSHMLLWLPAINLERLRGPVPVVTTDGMTWPDSGENTINYPTPVAKLGVDTSGVNLDGGAGCQPQAGPWGS